MFQYLFITCCSLTRWLAAKITTSVWSMNWPLNVLVQWQFVFKQSSSSCCSHFDIMRPRRNLTIYQQYHIARLQMGCSQREVATELKASQSVISRLQQRHRETGRVTERHRSGHPLATSHADDCFIVNSALWNRIMNATQLQARLKGLVDCDFTFLTLVSV